MQRYSLKRQNHMEYGFWLVFDADGAVRMSRGEPSIGRTERAMTCTARLPLSLFSTPTLKASITVAEGSPAAFAIDVEAASDALKTALGCDIDLTVKGPE